MKSYENTLQKYNVSVSGDLKVMKQNKLIELIPKNSRSFAAKHLGTTPQMVGAIERGDRTPSLKVSVK
jgi:hypothetical protein